jgi:hypothetical protein
MGENPENLMIIKQNVHFIGRFAFFVVNLRHNKGQFNYLTI